MTIEGTAAKPRSVAPLKNVSALMTLVETLQQRARGLPGLGVMAGPSGFGKTIASQYAQNELGAIYLEYRSFWTAKSFCQAFLAELGVMRAKGTIAQMMDHIIQIVSDANRPVIIDEADKLVDRGNIELIRDIYELAQVPIILVGEELLPQKLENYERVHNRVLDWVLAQPCDLEDTRALADYVCPSLYIGAPLLELIRADTGGRARRIATTLNEVGTFARNRGLTSVDIENFEGRIFTGVAPLRHGRGQ